MSKEQTGLDLQKIIEQSASELTPTRAEDLTCKMLGLFRFRLQRPYFVRIYDFLTAIGETLESDYPNTGKAFKSLTLDFANNEKAGFKLLVSCGVELLASPDPSEDLVLKTLSSHLPNSAKKQAVFEFLGLDKPEN